MDFDSAQLLKMFSFLGFRYRRHLSFVIPLLQPQLVINHLLSLYGRCGKGAFVL